jgi:hypothetical protein
MSRVILVGFAWLVAGVLGTWVAAQEAVEQVEVTKGPARPPVIAAGEILIEPAAADPAAPPKETPAAEADDDSVRPRPDLTPLLTDEQAEKRGWKRLTKEDQLWVDKKNNRVIVGGVICHREGPLEMFACPRQTKEHESVVSVNSRAFVMHAALLAVDAKPGRPVQFEPMYKPAYGQVIDIDVAWLDENNKQKSVAAQQWVRKVGTQEPLQYDWVFGGSLFRLDEETNRRYYLAEGGDLICVSNFGSAMLDLPVASSDSNSGLLFEAFTERIPELGTRVLVVLKPRPEVAE